jgi:hypothetical protein
VKLELHTALLARNRTRVLLAARQNMSTCDANVKHISRIELSCRIMYRLHSVLTSPYKTTNCRTVEAGFSDAAWEAVGRPPSGRNTCDLGRIFYIGENIPYMYYLRVGVQRWPVRPTQTSTSMVRHCGSTGAPPLHALSTSKCAAVRPTQTSTSTVRHCGSRLGHTFAC